MRNFVLAAFVLCISGFAFAQSESGGSLTGRVTQDGKPVAGAKVEVTVPDPSGNKTITAITDANGNYILENIKSGRHMIIAEGEPGKGIDSNTVEITAGSRSSMDMALTIKGYDAFSSQIRFSETVTISASQ